MIILEASQSGAIEQENIKFHSDSHIVQFLIDSVHLEITLGVLDGNKCHYVLVIMSAAIVKCFPLAIVVD
jgi:hypothetical protein